FKIIHDTTETFSVIQDATLAVFKICREAICGWALLFTVIENQFSKQEYDQHFFFHARFSNSARVVLQ
ncbi:hypothetical protein diail_9582, partial [Diaporthe ilicicola]